LSLQYLGVATCRSDRNNAEEKSVADELHSLFDTTQAEINFFRLDR
jgi:hypothetical protein